MWHVWPKTTTTRDGWPMASALWTLLRLEPDAIDTNIVYFRVDPSCGTAAEFCAALAAGLRMLPLGPALVRAVTHLDVSRDDVDRALEILAAVV